MTLASQIDADMATVFCNTNDFATSFTYSPKSGPSRTIKGIIEELGRLQDSASGIFQREEIEIMVSRTSSDACGGIDDPRIGDSITLADGRVFSYSGDNSDIERNSWWLRFYRDIQVQAGRTNTQAR
jgi:hypothetical protein